MCWGNNCIFYPAEIFENKIQRTQNGVFFAPLKRANGGSPSPPFLGQWGENPRLWGPTHKQGHSKSLAKREEVLLFPGKSLGATIYLNYWGKH